MAAQSSDKFANTLFDLITGHRVTAVIYVAAQLGICDLLAEGRKSATELARLTDTHERALAQGVGPCRGRHAESRMGPADRISPQRKN